MADVEQRAAVADTAGLRGRCVILIERADVVHHPVVVALVADATLVKGLEDPLPPIASRDASRDRRPVLDLRTGPDLWEAELALESPETSQPSEEACLATLMQNTPIPIINSPPERTWIWSDLHLADRAVLAAWNRPFRNIEEMNRHLLREWSRRIHADDTIICLGDLAHPDA